LSINFIVPDEINLSPVVLPLMFTLMLLNPGYVEIYLTIKNHRGDLHNIILRLFRIKYNKFLFLLRNLLKYYLWCV